jgi:hypothetical protein
MWKLIIMHIVILPVVAILYRNCDPFLSRSLSLIRGRLNVFLSILVEIWLIYSRNHAESVIN